MDPMDEIRETFFLECEELLEALDGDLSAMAHGEADREQVNAVFRAVHSIKGGAAAFGFDDLVRFSHTFETTLDEVRNDRLETTREVMDVFLRARDVLADLVTAARTGDDPPLNVDAVRDEIVNLTEVAGPSDPTPEAATDADADDEFGFQPMSLDIDDLEEQPAGRTFGIKFAPQNSLYTNGNEAARLLGALADLGEATVELDAADLPPLAEMEPEGAYLKWTVTLSTEQERDSVEEIFEFVDGECVLSIDEIEHRVSDGEADEYGFAPVSISVDVDEGPQTSGADEVSAAPDEKDAGAAKTSTPTAEKKPQAASSDLKSTIRVDLDRVDRLINMVGELVINQAMLSETVSDCGAGKEPTVTAGLEEFRRLTRELQDSVMAIRAQPVKSLFQRMSRIVRESAGMTQKTVRLNLVGETTEIDKTLVERLSEPLTHMIRNAVDHGLEDSETRIKAGKDPEGTVTLSAAHKSGRVLIEVSDDGAGVARDKVFKKAVERGLIPADQVLSDNEIDNLLFLPGFSTADTVSDLSGRGVGMDVVRQAIQSLGGRVEISSEPGKGTSFKISLPLTLAVLDGMLVKVAGQTLVAPVSVITETLKPSQDAIQSVQDRNAVIRVRDRYVPVYDVAAAFGYRDEPMCPEDMVILLIETSGNGPAALIVDEIVDQRQVVIKGLEKNYGRIPGIAAATILGDGQIALIMDAEAVVSEAKQRNEITAMESSQGEFENVVH